MRREIEKKGKAFRAKNLCRAAGLRGQPGKDFLIVKGDRRGERENVGCEGGVARGRGQQERSAARRRYSEI
jgi:hypothetical protein